MIKITRDTSAKKIWIAEYADFIGYIWKGSTNQMLGFRYFQIVTICQLRALHNSTGQFLYSVASDSSEPKYKTSSEVYFIFFRFHGHEQIVLEPFL